MKDKILYDFNLSKTVCNNLDEIVQSLNTDIIAAENDNLELLARTWNSEAATLFAEKYRGFICEVRRLSDEVKGETERIKTTSRKMYIIEQEAKKTVQEKGN